MNYTIHGQDLVLNFEFPRARYVSIYYNEIPVTDKFKTRSFWFWQRRRWFGNSGVFNAHINVYYPYIRLTLWSKWMIPKRIMIPLNVNHVQIQATLPSWQLKLPKKLKNPRLFLGTGIQKLQIPRLIENKNHFKSIEFELNSEFANPDEYLKYKTNHSIYIKNKEVWKTQLI